MAARENQGYLIAVILLVLLSVVLAIATYFGFTNMSEIADQRDDLQAQLVSRTNTSDAYREQAGILKSYLGLQGYSVAEVSTRLETLNRSGEQNVINETQSITDLYNEDMARYNNKPENEEGTWRGLVNDFADAVKNLHNTVIVQRSNIDRAEQQRQTDLAAKDKEIEAKDNQLNLAQQDLAEEKNRHAQTRTELESKLNVSEASVKNLNQRVQELQNIRLADKQGFDAELAKRQDTINALKAQVRRQTEFETEVADGQVVSVSPILGKVVINLGYEDNLRPQMTFAVYDQQLTSFEKGKQKAKIEIIRILNPHLAEARVVEQSHTDPILTRDFVVSSTWDPGYAVPIALAGVIDLDGDGVSDLQRLISIVRLNGGDVVAYHDEEGNVVGEIDENTRYFVRGQEPSDAQMAAAYARLDDQRISFEVQTISVRELLNSMGVTNEAKIQRMDSEMGQKTQFRPRLPGSVDGSAFDDN